MGADSNHSQKESLYRRRAVSERLSPRSINIQCWWGGWDSNPLSPKARDLQSRAALQLRRLPVTTHHERSEPSSCAAGESRFWEVEPVRLPSHHPFRPAKRDVQTHPALGDGIMRIGMMDLSVHNEGIYARSRKLCQQINRMRSIWRALSVGLAFIACERTSLDVPNRSIHFGKIMNEI